MTTPATDRSGRQAFSAGTSIGAAMLMMVLGVLSVLQGLAAVIDDDLFVVGANYTYQFDISTWGWIHTALGAVLIISAAGLIAGTTWGRVAAITIVSISLVANFLWLPYYPWWSIVIIALDIVVIWAITTWRPEGSRTL
ncbi:DUF7144 family membrane protein [Nocardia sp. NPDC003693]